MSREEQLKLGLVLQHEAYRNGVDDGMEGQFFETYRAVAGHSAMAERMESDRAYREAIEGIKGSDGVLAGDMEKMKALEAAYRSGDRSAVSAAQRAMGGQVLDNYDISADYWKVMKNGDLVQDGRKSVYKELDGGKEFKILDYGNLDSEEQSLAAMLNLYSDGKKLTTSEYQKKMMQRAAELNGTDIETAGEKLDEYRKANLDTQLARELMQKNGGILQGGGRSVGNDARSK